MIPDAMAAHQPIRVVKFGGSLLDLPGAGGSLASWLAKQPAARNVVVAGGGKLADVVRDAFDRHDLPEVACHWMCVDLLSVTARLLAELMPGTPVESAWDWLAGSEATTIILDVAPFLHAGEAELPGRPLEHTWRVTSDSIAARLAEVLSADELVLLKSRPPMSGSLRELAERGFVDECFPVAASSIGRIRLVNFRDPTFHEVVVENLA